LKQPPLGFGLWPIQATLVIGIVGPKQYQFDINKAMIDA